MDEIEIVAAEVPKIKEYVVGFMFDDYGERVILIRKNRPEWQAGKANGVGGKVEPGEMPMAAMIREFREETGVETTSSDWENFAVMRGRDFEIAFYRGFNSKYFSAATTTTDEWIIKAFIWNLDNTAEVHPVPNVKWLVPMALTKNLRYAELTYEEAA
jgi:8-oxo-dGTP diphosphatase